MRLTVFDVLISEMRQLEFGEYGCIGPATPNYRLSHDPR
jgi:hypothetical protein